MINPQTLHNQCISALEVKYLMVDELALPVQQYSVPDDPCYLGTLFIDY